MKKKYRLMVVFSYCLLMMILLVGCGSSEKSLKEIKEDLNMSSLVTEYAYIEEDIYEVTEIELIKRNTQDEYMDDVFVNFQMENKDCMISGQLELVYNFYSTGGWILDGIYPIGEFVYAPLVGQTEFLAEEDLFYQGYTTYKLKEHTTDLENQIDYLVYDVSCESPVYSINGCVNMIYIYDGINGEWVFDGIQTEEGYAMTWNAPGTYAINYTGGGSTLYYLERIENGVMYGKSFFVSPFGSFSPEDNATSKEWADEEWVIDLHEKTLTSDNHSTVLRFDQEGVYSEWWDSCPKVSEGCVDPKAYTESINGIYYGLDIGGAPVLNY